MVNRGGFSWKRALGISAAKSRLSRKICIPLTRSGRQRKAGAALGCATFMLTVLIILVISAVVLGQTMP